MKIDAGLVTSLDDAPALARRLEAQGFDGIVSIELSSDPFFPLLLAAEHTERVEIMTSIAVAFSRNPMILANLANDLQAELNTLSKRGEWETMGERITDEILEEFAVVAEPHRVAGALKARLGGMVDRLPCTFPSAPDEERQGYVEELRGA